MMNDRENENMRDRGGNGADDEGWVYPDRLPGQNVGTAYGYDVKRRTKQPVNRGAVRHPRQPVNTNPGSLQRRTPDSPASGHRQGNMQYNDRQPGNYQSASRQTARQRPSDAAQNGQQRNAQRVYTDPRYPARQNAGRRHAAQNGARPAQSRAPQTQRAQTPGRTAQAQNASGGRGYGKEGFLGNLLSNISVKSVAIAAAIILAVILLIILIPKLKGSGAPAAETDTVIQTETPTPTEAEAPEPETPPTPYFERTADTKQFAADELSCDYAILVDVDGHKVIAETGGDDRIYPASMTKVMTVLTAIDKCEDLGAKFTMTDEIVAPLLSLNATSAGFLPGEEVTVKDLMYGALLPSGADGTGGLAVFTAGSESAFAEMMNEKCAELGLTGSHFVNASGLHADGHYSTCYDIAVIFEKAMENPDIAAALGSWEYTTEATPQHPEGIHLYHTLLYERLEGSEEFDEKIEVIGGKTGFTDEAGNCLVTMAKVLSTGKRYIFVCAKGDTKWEAVYDTIHVYRTYLGEQFDGEYVPKYMR